MGISLQGVHYRVKRNQLNSVRQDGKLFIYLDEESINTNKVSKPTSTLNSASFLENSISELLLSKDEQIDILKKTIKWMRRQHLLEIKRLEKSQKRAIEVFNSEIKLLQSAFNEMRTIYKTQIPQVIEKKVEPKNEIELKKNDKKEFLSFNEFFIILKKASKTDEEIKSIIVEAIENGDERFIYNKATKKLLILNDSFEDMIE